LKGIEMLPKIRWTQAERIGVVFAAVKYYNQGNYTALAALRQAQQLVLPSDRRRNFAGHSAAVDLIKEVKQKAAQDVPKQLTMEIYAPPEKTPPAPQEVAKTDAPVDLVEQLVNTITQRFILGLRESLQIAVRELEHEFKIPKHNPTYEATGDKLPKVVIIGLLGDQVHLILKEFSDRYNLNCIDTDRAMGMNPPDADAYLLMKNFINHPLYHKYQAFPNHVLIDGGMSTLRMWLNTKGKDL
jgi:hypothetical protein